MSESEIIIRMENCQNIKCVLVGDVDKSRLLTTYITGAYPEDFVPTVFENYSTIIVVDGKPIQLGLWDTEGQEDCAPLRPLSYSKTDVFLVCFSISSRSSFENVKTKWIPEIKDHVPSAPFLLVGTEKHLRDDQEVTQKVGSVLQMSDGESMAKELGAKGYHECSALTSEGVKDVFDEAVRAALSKKGSGQIGRCKCQLL